MQAAQRTNYDLFNSKVGTTTEEKIDAQKQKFEEYIGNLEDYDALYELEAKYIKKGYYRRPFNTDLRHRESNPLWASMKAD